MTPQTTSFTQGISALVSINTTLISCLASYVCVSLAAVVLQGCAASPAWNRPLVTHHSMLDGALRLLFLPRLQSRPRAPDLCEFIFLPKLIHLILIVRYGMVYFLNTDHFFRLPTIQTEEFIHFPRPLYFLDDMTLGWPNLNDACTKKTLQQLPASDSCLWFTRE